MKGDTSKMHKFLQILKQAKFSFKVAGLKGKLYVTLNPSLIP